MIPTQRIDPYQKASNQGFTRSLLTGAFLIGSLAISHAATVTAVNSRAWSVGSAWDTGSPPGPNDSVIIPSGITVRYTPGSPVSIKDLTIQGQLTIVPDGDRELSSNWVLIDGGNIQAGTSGAEFSGSFTLTLEGDFPDATNAGMAKQDAFLMTKNGGSLRLFGTAKTPYQKLQYVANVGDTQIRLRDGDLGGWAIGDEIAITSTVQDWKQTEVRTITGIDDAGFGIKVDLNAGLTYKHHGAGRHSEKVYEGSRVWFVDESAEVANLTRNIKIQGDANSVTDGIGGHVMFMANSDIQIQGVEFYRMGQKKRMGRYPIHWHPNGDSAGDFVRNCSIYKSYNRAITIHGTHGVSVENNVAYDHVGHGLFLEDGVEINNIIRGNIMFGTRRPSSADALIPTDVRPVTDDRFVAPGTYWITNPNNIVENNVAAGGDGIGFWYAHPQRAMGESYASGNYNDVFPDHVRLGSFDGNSMHSLRSGLVSDQAPRVTDGEPVSTGYNPTNNGQPNGTPVRETFRNFIVYHTNSSGEYLRGRRSDIDNGVFVDNRRSNFNTNDTVVSNSLFLAKSNLNPIDGKTSAIVMYDGPAIYENCHFMKFDNDDSTMISHNAGTFKFVPNVFSGTTMDNGTRSRGLRMVDKKRFEPLPTTTYRTQTHTTIFWDTDGTLSGSGNANTTIARNHPFNTKSGDVTMAGSEFAYGIHTFASLHLESKGRDNAPDQPIFKLERPDGVSATILGDAPPEWNQQCAVMMDGWGNGQYILTWPFGIPSMRTLIGLGGTMSGSVILKVPNVRSTFQVYSGATRVYSVGGVNVTNVNCYYFDSSNNTVFLKLVAAPSRKNVDLSW